MNKMRSRTRGSARWVLAALGTLALSAVGGCLDDSQNDGAEVASGAAPASGEAWVEAWDATGRPQLPTSDELATALALSDAQTATLDAALATWRAEMDERVAALGADRLDGRPGHGVPGGFGEFEPPMLGFLATVVPGLDGTQVDALVALLEEKREAGAAESGRSRPGRLGHRRPRHGPAGSIGGVLRELREELDLSRDQHEALRTLIRDVRETFRGLRISFRDGKISAEELRDAAHTTRVELETQLEAILGASSFGLVMDALAERRAEVVSRRLENLEAHMQRRLEFLSKVLGLDEAQFTQVTSVLADSIEPRRALLEALRDGTIEIEEALYQGYILAESTGSAIRALLTPEQQEVFDALKRLLPGHHGPRH